MSCCIASDLLFLLQSQFRAARMYSSLVMAAAVAGMLLVRYYLASKVRLC